MKNTALGNGADFWLTVKDTLPKNKNVTRFSPCFLSEDVSPERRREEKKEKERKGKKGKEKKRKKTCRVWQCCACWGIVSPESLTFPCGRLLPEALHTHHQWPISPLERHSNQRLEEPERLAKHYGAQQRGDGLTISLCPGTGHSLLHRVPALHGEKWPKRD